MLSNSITFPCASQSPSSSTLVDAGGVSAPPASNTGVQNTLVSEGGGVDWLSFTKMVDGRCSLAAALAWVHCTFGPGVPLERGGLGYTHSEIICETGRVFWSPDRQSQGVHVRLPASALGWLVASDRWVWADPRAFALFLWQAGAKFSRADFAMDDRTGALDLELIDKYYAQGWLTTRWRKGQVIEGRLGSRGKTLYFGSRSSESFLRIYDKAAERLDRGEASVATGTALPVARPAGDVELAEASPCNRVEIEFKGEKAHAAVVEYIAFGLPAIVGILRGLIEFKEPGEDTNPSRWAPATWWVAFLDGVEKSRLVIAKAEKTVERVARWLEKQVAPSLAFLTLYLGDGMDSIKELIKSGQGRLNPWQVAALTGG